ncbi:hypothetical protein EDD18DRAFT_186593 [Armillaria luteobubalina]|uniref:Uncharacterized protein n=1 Tax=Armillaria luteobubalina TaxID=153913 RepID=A0AA39Q7K9_9AGAR|nr:hypothetical protein EDD18DRAFT_186593 [Armillaria luteobubalina]
MPEHLPLELLKCTTSSPYLLASHPLFQPTAAIELDGVEYSWGLQRGDINAYLDTADNTLRLDSSLVNSFKESLWLLAPTGETLDRIVECYNHNQQKNAPSRTPFYEVCPLAQEYEYTIIPLRLNGPIYGKSPSGKIVSFADPFNDLVVTSRANPFFVAALASCYSRCEIEAPVYSTIALKLLRIFFGSHALAPLKFYEGSRPGDFGRELPDSYRDLPQFASENSSSRLPALTISPASSSSENIRPFKRSKEDLSEEEDEEKYRKRNSVNVFKWMQDTKPAEFVLVTRNDEEIGSYALETPREIVGKIPTDADAMWWELVEKGADSNLHTLKRKRSPS